MTKMYKIIKTLDGWMLQRPDGTYIEDAEGNNCFDDYMEAFALFINVRVKS